MKINLKSYFLRRLTRLEPPYILMLLAVAAADVLARDYSMASLPRLSAALGYQHFMAFGELYPANGATWSLETEVQFYCLTPLLVAVFLIRPTWLRRSIVATAILFFALASMSRLATYARWDVCVVGHLHEFLAGYLLADIYILEWQEAPPVGSRLWDAVALLGWAAIPFVITDRCPNPCAPRCPSSCSSFARRRCEARSADGSSPGAGSRPPGRSMCYTIYLFHGPLMRFTRRWAEWVVSDGSPERFFFGYAVAWLPIVALGALVLFVTIERPCMNPDWPARLAVWLRCRIGAGRRSPLTRKRRAAHNAVRWLRSPNSAAFAVLRGDSTHQDISTGAAERVNRP